MNIRAATNLVGNAGSLMKVLPVRQLLEHEVGNISPRNTHRDKETADPGAMVVATTLFAVCQLPRPNNGPIQPAFFDQAFLFYFISKIPECDNGNDEQTVIQPQLPSGVTYTEGGFTDKPANTMLVHRVDDVCRTG